MNEQTILGLFRLPARLDVHQTAELLGFMDHDIPVLVQMRLLNPLGDPLPNGHKYFSTNEIETLAQDRQWLDRATKAVTRHWKIKNQNKKVPLSAA